MAVFSPLFLPSPSPPPPTFLTSTSFPLVVALLLPLNRHRRQQQQHGSIVGWEPSISLLRELGNPLSYFLFPSLFSICSFGDSCFGPVCSKCRLGCARLIIASTVSVWRSCLLSCLEVFLLLPMYSGHQTGVSSLLSSPYSLAELHLNKVFLTREREAFGGSQAFAIFGFYASRFCWLLLLLVDVVEMAHFCQFLSPSGREKVGQASLIRSGAFFRQAGTVLFSWYSLPLSLI